MSAAQTARSSFCPPNLPLNRAMGTFDLEFPMKNWLCCALLSLVLTLPAFAQSGSTSALEMAVHVPVTRVRFDETLPISVVWKNRSPSQTLVLRGEPGPSAAGGLSLFVIDANRSSRPLPVAAGRMTLQEVVSGSRRIELAPGHGHGIAKRFRVNEVFPSPGRYRIEARYQSPIPIVGNPTISPEAIEGSSAVAISVEIEVTP